MRKGLSQKFMLILVAGLLLLALLTLSLFLLRREGFELFDQVMEELKKLWEGFFDLFE